MAQAKNGDTVKVHYTGKLDDGTVFDSSHEGEPLKFKIGEEDLIPSFEDAIVGMEAGDTKTIQIEANDAYGPHRAELVFEVGRDKLPPDLQPEIGQQLQFQHPDGSVIDLMISEVSTSDVKLDANHPLAGEQLTFDLELVEISEGDS